MVTEKTIGVVQDVVFILGNRRWFHVSLLMGGKEKASASYGSCEGLYLFCRVYHITMDNMPSSALMWHFFKIENILQDDMSVIQKIKCMGLLFHDSTEMNLHDISNFSPFF